MSTKSLKKQLMAAIAMVLVAAIALGSSTYAWFISNTQVKATSASMTSKTAYTLLISKGAKASDGSSDWGSVHEWTDGKDGKQIEPVSTTGKLNDGKELEFAYDTTWKSANADVADQDIAKGGNYASGFTKATDATKYIKESFEIKAAQNCQLILDKDTVIAGTSGELDRTLRQALVIDDGTTQKVFMYQVNGASGTAAQLNTTADSNNKSANGIKNAIDPTTLAVADISSSVNLDGEGNVITLANGRNTGSGESTIMDTQSDDSVLYTFNINTKDTIAVTAYIWMEGCDYDCNALETQHFKDTTSALPVTAALSFSAAMPTA